MSLTITGAAHEVENVTHSGNVGKLYVFDATSASPAFTTSSITPASGSVVGYLIGRGGNGSSGGEDESAASFIGGGGGGGGGVVSFDFITLPPSQSHIIIFGSPGSVSKITNGASDVYISGNGGSAGDIAGGIGQAGGSGADAVSLGRGGGGGGGTNFSNYDIGAGGAGGSSSAGEAAGAGGSNSSGVTGEGGNGGNGAGAIAFPFTTTGSWGSVLNGPLGYGGEGATPSVVGTSATGYGGGGGGNFNGATTSSGKGAAVLIWVKYPAPSTPADAPTLVGSVTSTGFNVEGDMGLATGAPFTSATFKVYEEISPGTFNHLGAKDSIDSGDKVTYAGSFTGLTPNTNYEVTWYLTNSAGDSEESAALSLLTLPSTPVYSSTSGNGPTGFTVNWTGGINDPSVTYTVTATDPNSSVAYATSPAYNTATFTGLSSSTAYSVVIKAENITGYVTSTPQTITTTSGGGGGGGSNPICFLRGSKILCLNQGLKEEYIPIEQIPVGMPVKTLKGQYIKVHSIGKMTFINPNNADRGPNRLFKLTPANYPELTEDLIVTGCHSRLVDKLEPKQKARHLQLMKTLYLTTDKFRLMAFIDEKAEPYIAPGDHEIWHLALENENRVCNYGIYANGLLVETASIKNMTERSGLVLIE